MGSKLNNTILTLIIANLIAIIINYYTSVMPVYFQNNQDSLKLLLLILIIIQILLAVKGVEHDNISVEKKDTLPYFIQPSKAVQVSTLKEVIWLRDELSEYDNSILNFEGFNVTLVKYSSEAFKKIQEKECIAVVIGDAFPQDQIDLLQYENNILIIIYSKECLESKLNNYLIPKVSDIHDLVKVLNHKIMFN